MSPGRRTVKGIPTRFVLDRASDGCRHLFVSYFVEQQSYSEISEASGQPVGTDKGTLEATTTQAR